ncbi:toxin-antitoxin system HicB family antitoxin [Jiangella ureilytica]|uniref:Toxin-antitoxin system HicB family antitoxin n=1 Tax=Jiangella ureilytica TaxID=2530374 RepID=A0A4R4RYK0_9ACTN|nr:toxin-antitoxin system HicB family antitoxin [Jiangella ureilytica]TDC53783.1 toxin-antitoxin system HicB family antitoxin [Jiangella ureilytica]
MELTQYVEALRGSLAAAGQAAADDVRDAAERLSYAVEPSLRLTLLEALGDAAAEITHQLDDIVVEVRLRGGDPEMVATETVAAPPRPPHPPVPPVPPSPPEDEGTSRVSLRLPETLKVRVEEAAAAEGMSVNAWLIRAVLQTFEPARSSTRVSVGRNLSGWVR